MKKIILVCGVILALAAVICVSISPNKEAGVKEEQGKIEQEEKIPLGSEVFISSVDSYIGAYVEDGIDEYVENVLSIIIENNGSKHIQFMNVTIDEKYEFTVSTLLPGTKVLVLEKSRAEYEQGINLDNVVVSNVAFFGEEPSMHEELLEISGKDNRIFIKNVSDQTFPGGKVFYKNKFEDKYIGGITYTGTIPALEKDETIVLDSVHYQEDSSELMFVTYAE